MVTLAGGSGLMSKAFSFFALCSIHMAKHTYTLRYPLHIVNLALLHMHFTVINFSQNGHSPDPHFIFCGNSSLNCTCDQVTDAAERCMLAVFDHVYISLTVNTWRHLIY